MTISKPDFDSEDRIKNNQKHAHKVIAIASSFGGIKALEYIVSRLPPSFIGSIIVVQHLSPNYKSYLVEILARCTSLKVVKAEEGMEIHSGTIYITPPNKHLIVNSNKTLSLSSAPKEHFVRPSAEYTFKSLAENYKNRAIAIVLTGYDGDGKEGVKAIKEMGGKVIAQDKETSKVFSMPKSAIETGCVDLILPIEDIVDGIVNLVYS